MAALLLQDWPDAYCYVCLSSKLRLAEPLIRDAAQVLLITRPEFRVQRRFCTECGRLTDVLELTSARR